MKHYVCANHDAEREEHWYYSLNSVCVRGTAQRRTHRKGVGIIMDIVSVRGTLHCKRSSYLIEDAVCVQGTSHRANSADAIEYIMCAKHDTQCEGL